MVLRADSDEPQRVHPLQVWKSPYVSDTHAAAQPVGTGPLARIGNADLVRGISDCLAITRAVTETTPTSEVYEALAAVCVRAADSHYWLGEPELGDLHKPLTQVRATAEQVLAEFETVQALTRQAADALTDAAARVAAVVRRLRGEAPRSAAAWVTGLTELRHAQGHHAPVMWRGPLLHRALQQFLGEVYWGDLDVLLLDLPPGTGDIPISLAQLLPESEILVVTTPQAAAAEVAERAGAVSLQTGQRVAGVVENMSWLQLPDGSTTRLFGSGGGRTVADSLSLALGTDVPLLGQVPMDPLLGEAGDAGTPLVLSAPEAPAAVALRAIAEGLAVRRRGLAGCRLPVSPS
ncbi:hypothetical protein QFZ66_001012 [Streptomyces sp. B4I13]|uniref:DNA repair ATPase n=1 Tax=Streptomyces sp. B4I13 TaxID=3042271 RepID=UPI00278AFA4C|nr:DNA repair ATPase [Streptomyces sp. B4I13]MDQ0957134.1 hypothetical protein [Streptomyces sp. B4I13]